MIKCDSKDIYCLFFLTKFPQKQLFLTLIISVIVFFEHQLSIFNSIQDYLYIAFYDTIVAKQLYRKFSFYNRFIYYRNLIYITYGKIWLIPYTV